MKKLFFLSIIASCLGLTGCCGYRTVSCPDDGRPVNVPKSQRCAERFYKDVAKEFSSSISATLNVVDKVTVGIDSFILRNRVIPLKDKLSNESSRMELLCKTSFYGLLNDPCGRGAAHDALLKLIAEKNYQLEDLRVSLERSASNNKSTNEKGDEIKKAISEFDKKYLISKQ